MADVQATPLQDYGALMQSFPTAQANIGLTQAQTGLAQAQTTGANISNTTALMTQQLFKTGLNGLLASNAAGPGADNSGADSSGAPSSGNYFDPAAVDAGLRQRYFVNPAGSPGQQKQIQLANLSGNKGLVDFATSQRDLGVQSQTSQNQMDANTMYDGMTAVSTAPPGAAMRALEAVNPAAAAQIKQATDDPSQEDDAARQLATHVAASVHQYSGRKVTADTAGVYRDEVTGQPVTGLPQAGLSSQQWMEVAKDAYGLVDVKNSDGSTSQVPRYLSPGQPGGGNASAWIKSIVSSRYNAAGASPTMGGAPAAQANAAANAAAKAAKVNAPVVGSSDPVMNKALSDKTYDLKSQPDLPTFKAGSTPSTTEAAALKDVGDARNAAFKDTQAILGPQQQALTFYKAAQDILDSKGAKTSAYAPIIAEAKRWIPGFDALDTSNYQELAKYLSNAAIQSAAAVFPKMTDSAKKLALNVLNPSASMNDTATRNMIITNMKNSQYLIDTANRFKQYNQAGKDPRSFYDWNRQYFPQEDAVVKNKSMPTGDKFQTYAKTHFGGDNAKATAFLQSQGYK